MLSTHPKVGMAVLVGVRVKAKVRALARRDAHSFLAVRAGDDWALAEIGRAQDWYMTG